MFDLFGLKAKRSAAEFKRKLVDMENVAQELKFEVIKRDGELAKVKEQIKTVRVMANQMRDRVRSHGATELERNFLDVCMNIHANGKMISTMRFHHMLALAKKERDSLTQAVGDAQ